MDYIEMIDSELEKIRNSEGSFDYERLSRLVLLISERIRILHRQHPGLVAFRNAIRAIDVGEEDLQKLILLRNSLAHSKDTPQINESWIREIIIPAVMNIKPPRILESARNFTEAIFSELQKKLDKSKFELEREKEFGGGRFRRRADFAIRHRESDGYVLIESKFARTSPSEKGLDRIEGIEQLTRLLVLAGCTCGVLLVPGIEEGFSKLEQGKTSSFPEIVKSTPIEDSIYILNLGVNFGVDDPESSWEWVPKLEEFVHNCLCKPDEVSAVPYESLIDFWRESSQDLP
ncbi:MAG: hypothetical protein ACFFER_08465 [Candidatus Thorarchaeota archaeon]